ncbi:hypothetical protein ACFOTA_11670 [Chitinophaga sp. GCM10012297]|uniref:CHAD domain-containing protein n=1 Tax=Chitinophaga chungangae TaxID=2821488 RepID=A0ABS3YDX4_9BACT|nr:hypothetical protein [Chitinophaga chungangae]MBO9152869.1 hypothetical protein [Chitinophaga chungangae]
MKNTRLAVNRNFRIRMCQMRKAVRRIRQIQHQQQVSLYESFRKADRLHERLRGLWEFPGA